MPGCTNLCGIFRDYLRRNASFRDPKVKNLQSCIYLPACMYWLLATTAVWLKWRFMVDTSLSKKGCVCVCFFLIFLSRISFSVRISGPKWGVQCLPLCLPCIIARWGHQFHFLVNVWVGDGILRKMSSIFSSRMLFFLLWRTRIFSINFLRKTIVQKLSLLLTTSQIDRIHGLEKNMVLWKYGYCAKARFSLRAHVAKTRRLCLVAMYT